MSGFAMTDDERVARNHLADRFDLNRDCTMVAVERRLLGRVMLLLSRAISAAEAKLPAASLDWGPEERAALECLQWSLDTEDQAEAGTRKVYTVRPYNPASVRRAVETLRRAMGLTRRTPRQLADVVRSSQRTELVLAALIEMTERLERAEAR